MISPVPICALAFLALAGLSPAHGASLEAPAISLAGDWAFRLDPARVGLEEAWQRQALPDRCKLPGSTDENRYGSANLRQDDFSHLSRLYEYVGPAWYQREVQIPEAWRGKRVTLFLERCHWETRAWLDDRDCGMQDSLCVPHLHDLGPGVTPGRHHLTLRVDNTVKFNVGGWAHSITEETQTNWNGVVGRLELRATDPVWIEEAQVYPDPAARSVRVRITVGNATGQAARGSVVLSVLPAEGGAEVGVATADFSAPQAACTVEATVPLSAAAKPWDEFSPALLEMRASLRAQVGGQACSDARAVTFGLRDFSVRDKRLTLNGRPVFLRGTLECCIFPLTGYPATDVESWLRILRTCRSYGLNHMRFHSWCPPDAAFEAADQLGFLFHVELPQWVGNVGQEPPRDAFIQAELTRILAAYGNHPSFGMLCMGNELGGDASFLAKLVQLGRDTDPRHLYTSSTAWSHVPQNQYDVSVIRGLHGPGTDADFRPEDARSAAPTISHEVGQWTVFPNLAEMSKYTGVLWPRNFEIVRGDLARHGLLAQAPEFVQASGKLMVQLYKEEIEVLLRTPGHGGFELLDLHDFPGQGTSLVGVLDPFWDTKGLVTPEQWRRFCGPTVPLLRMAKRTFTSDETFVARAEIAHFGATALPGAAPVWTIKDDQGREVAAGAFPPTTIPTGGLTSLGEVRASLAQAPAPAHLTVTVSLPGTDIGNDWSVWVYPAAGAPAAAAPAASFVRCRAWDAPALAALAAGKSVLLLAGPDILSQSLPGSFTPVFWNPVMFRNQPGTMGILCDPRHPALAQFPTEAHTDWQWYDLLERSRTMILDDLPADFRPLVQVIDNYSRNHRLGNLLEARVGPGRLLVCSLNLSGDLAGRPAARQLLRSLEAYVASPAFSPPQELTVSALSLLLRPASPLAKMREAPQNLDRAVLRVRAAVKVPAPNVPEAWRPQADEVLVQKPGFGYAVSGSTWRDETGSAWHDSSDLTITVTCPPGFQGKFYAHFHDWNNLDRVAEIWFQDRLVGTLEDYNGPGVWLAFPVTAKYSAGGKLVLSSRPTHANTMITQIVVTANAER